MKNNIDNNNNNQGRVIAALVLTGVLSVGSSVSLMKSANAMPKKFPVIREDITQIINNNSRAEALPSSVAIAVKRDIAKKEGISPESIEITNYNQHTWNNGCMGVGEPGQICTQALVSGWIITASDGNQNWVYHTNSNGSILRLASSDNNSNNLVNLPRNIIISVLRAASKQLKMPVTSGNIESAQKRSFKNGCLDLGKPNEICSTALVNGWQVIVNIENQILVYHTNENGSVIKLNDKESQTTSDKQFPAKTRDAVLRVASRRLRESLSIGNIMLVEKRTFGNGCLDLAKRNEACSTALVEGWRVVVGVPERTLVYHTNNNGSVIRLNEKESEMGDTTSNDKLPQRVQNAVVRAASQRLQKRVTARNITDSEKRVWAGGCLELARPNEPCTRNMVPGWRVVVEVDNQMLVFHTNENGTAIRLNEKESQISRQELPQRLRSAVIRDAIKWSGLTASKLRIVKAEAKTWDNPCFLTFDAICNKALIPTPGWEVTLESDTPKALSSAYRQTWVYRTDEEALVVSLDRTRSLEEEAAKAIKRDAGRRSNFQTALRIIDVKSLEDWNDICKDVPNCTRPIVPGYEATVSNGRESWVYRVKRDGSQFELSPIANLPYNAVPIPKNELPPALTGNVVFRQISSGGFVGRSYETLLLEDGRLMQYRIGDANDSERRVWRISTEQYNNFISLLMNSGFQEFRGLNFPAPNGAADYITYFLTTGDMTIQYNDISQNNLPKNMGAVVNAWNQISKSYR